MKKAREELRRPSRKRRAVGGPASRSSEEGRRKSSVAPRLRREEGVCFRERLGRLDSKGLLVLLKKV
jgi:hypothetical protein